jgi:hypothetical protein
MKNNFILLSGILILIASCNSEDKNSGGSSMFGIGADAVESLPQVDTGPSVKNRTLITGGNISTYNTLATFFKLECFMPDGDNFCPAGTDVSAGMSSPYKLTSYTLIGSIYHADMYSGGLKTGCEGTAATITPASFTSADAGGDPDIFLLDYYTLLTCVEEITGSYVGTGTSYQTYSLDSGQTYQATLTTRYRNPFEGVSTPGQNDIFQVYVGLSSGDPVFLAYNYAGADTVFQRTVLLVNLTDHKFAVKHYENATNYLVAIGVGGIDRQSGVLNPGYYYTRFTNNGGTEDDGCVDNATGNFGTDTSSCTNASVPMGWSSSDSVSDYLGMTSEQRTHLASFLAKFTDDGPLAGTDSPSNNTSDPELYLPYTITP